MQTWILYIQNQHETIDLKTERFASYDEALEQAKRIAPSAKRGGSCIGVRRVDIPRPEAEDRDRILAEVEEEEEEEQAKRDGKITIKRRKFGIDILKRLLDVESKKKHKPTRN